MPRTNPLSKAEVRICQRLMLFRSQTGLARVAFAKRIGIDSSALMRSELGRVPVTYELFLAVTRHYGINPNWLFSGKGSQTTGRILNYDAIAGGISPKEYFSAFYKNRFAELFDKLNATASATIDDLTRMLIKINTELENNPGALPPRALAKAAQIARKVIRSVEKMRKIGTKSRRRVRR